MSWVDDLRPIRLFSFYLAFIFFVSTYLRWRQYHAVIALVTRLQSRWPNLTRLVLAHRSIFLTWRTVLPLVLVAGVLLANFLASRLVWPLADQFTFADLLSVWPALWPIAFFGACMLIIDIVGTVRVGQIDLKQTEGYFDLAEVWLSGWRAPVVHFLSLGYINPRQMVSDQVRDALTEGSRLLHTNLWWMTAQTVFRIGFGASLWISFALEGWIHSLLGTA